MEVDAVEGPRRTTWRMGLRVGQLCHIQRMQPIHILVLQDGVQDQVFVNVRRQGQLHQDAVDLRVWSW